MDWLKHWVGKIKDMKRLNCLKNVNNSSENYRQYRYSFCYIQVWIYGQKYMLPCLLWSRIDTIESHVNWQSHSSRLIFHVFKDLFLWLFTEYFSLNFFQLWARPVLWLGMWVACLANMSVRQLELPSSPTNCKFRRDKLLPFLLSVALTVEHNWNRCTDIHIHRHISF